MKPLRPPPVLFDLVGNDRGVELLGVHLLREGHSGHDVKFVVVLEGERNGRPVLGQPVIWICGFVLLQLGLQSLGLLLVILPARGRIGQDPVQRRIPEGLFEPHIGRTRQQVAVKLQAEHASMRQAQVRQHVDGRFRGRLIRLRPIPGRPDDRGVGRGVSGVSHEAPVDRLMVGVIDGADPHQPGTTGQAMQLIEQVAERFPAGRRLVRGRRVARARAEDASRQLEPGRPFR